MNVSNEQRRADAFKICLDNGFCADAIQRILAQVESSIELESYRRPNLSSAFLAALTRRLQMVFLSEDICDGEAVFGPEAVFGYIYAVLHSPSYRARYSEFLKRDFPRVPLPINRAFFLEMAALERELVKWHTLEGIEISQVAAPDGIIEKGFPVWESGRVWISEDACFENVSCEVWEFKIGGYQVARKWLSDRRGRDLSPGEAGHYRATLDALTRTMEVMCEVDCVVNRFGGWEQISRE